MSQVKRLKEMGIEFEDPKMWKLLEMLDDMPRYLAEEQRKKEEERQFAEKVWGPAFRKAGLL